VCGRLVCEPEEGERLQRRLAAPSLSDAVDALLVRRGFAQEPPPASPAGGATAPEEWRLRALVRIYEEPDTHADLVALCEVLIEMDECLALWRAHHVQMVERMIGAKRGTGGSEGVTYLRSTLPKRAFPDLWRVRSHLGQEPETQA
jgi:tryptophan 2,3-dioxygenase